MFMLICKKKSFNFSLSFLNTLRCAILRVLISTEADKADALFSDSRGLKTLYCKENYCSNNMITTDYNFYSKYFFKDDA